MGKVATGLSMSLDGFIAGPDDGPHSPFGDGSPSFYLGRSSMPPNLGRRTPSYGFVGVVRR